MLQSRAFSVCHVCMAREGGGPYLEAVEGPNCFICGGLFEKIPGIAASAVKKVGGYNFSSFSVGISLPEGVQEREDEVRASLKLKGSETVKTQAARTLAGLISSQLGKPVDKSKPDLTVLAGILDGSVSIASRPIFYYGRYSKPSGLSQKKVPCPHCSGAGCSKCRDSGYSRKPSVEGFLRRRISALTGTDRMIFTWIGSEDESSKVVAPGRPFVAEIKNPRFRSLPGSFVARLSGKQVSVRAGRMLPGRPTGLPRFRFKTTITCKAKSRVDSATLKEVKRSFHRTMVRFERPHNRPTTKMVFQAEAKMRKGKIQVVATLEGGLPVKRFISGEMVTPSVSEVLKTEVRCQTFDICEVVEKGTLTYAEITRV